MNKIIPLAFLGIFLFVINSYAQNSPSSIKQQENRIALVIGNGNYLAGNLANPENDAKEMTAVLQKIGFIVYEYENLTASQMKKAIDDFGVRLKGNDVGLFYYAGHGIQAKGNNYLIPIDAELKSEEYIEYDCVQADRVLAAMQSAKSKVNIMILDACRNNPFERSWTRSTNGKGLAFMDAPSGTLIAYATSPGRTASDGGGKNGLYTSAILESIQVPNLTIIQLFQNVRKVVSEKSQNKQIPWESTSLIGDFYFVQKVKTNTLNKTDIGFSDLNSVAKDSSIENNNGNEKLKLKISWVLPDDLSPNLFSDSIIQEPLLVFSRSPITRLSVYINEEPLNISYAISRSDQEDEYKISATFPLKLGINSVYFEVKNMSEVAISSLRVMKYMPYNEKRFYNPNTEKRLALIIANADYSYNHSMPTLISDAILLENALKDVGFKVMSYHNADMMQTKRLINEFVTQLKTNSVGLFYYMGYGMQVQGNNYIIPTDANTSVDRNACINFLEIVNKMKTSSTTTNILLFDASYLNSYDAGWTDIDKNNGLATMMAPPGFIIAFSECPGKIEIYNSGNNSIYTNALVKYLKVPGLSIEELFKNVRTMVEQKSNATQSPWESDSLKKAFYFMIE